MPWQTFNWIQLPVCDYLMNIWWNINLLLWMAGLVFIWLAISEDWFMVKFLFLCFFPWLFLCNPSWWHTRLRLMLLAWVEQHHCLLAVLETLWNNICKDLGISSENQLSGEHSYSISESQLIVGHSYSIHCRV